MADETIHLATGIEVCGVPRVWCRAEVKRDDEGRWWATQAKERCTCQPCLAELAAVETATTKLTRR